MKEIKGIWLRRKLEDVKRCLEKNNIPYEIWESETGEEIRVKTDFLRNVLDSFVLKKHQKCLQELGLTEPDLLRKIKNFNYLIFWY